MAGFTLFIIGTPLYRESHHLDHDSYIGSLMAGGGCASSLARLFTFFGKRAAGLSVSQRDSSTAGRL